MFVGGTIKAVPQGFDPSMSGTVVLNQCRVILNQGEFLVDLLRDHKTGKAPLPDQLEPLIERAREAVEGAGNILEAVEQLNLQSKTGNKISAQHPRELQSAVAGLTRQITVALSGKRAMDEHVMRELEAQLLHVKEAIKNVVLAIEGWKVSEGRAERKKKAVAQIEQLQGVAGEVAKGVKEVLVLTKGQINPEEFVGKAKETLNKLDYLVEMASDLNLPKEGSDLRDATVEFIGAATAVLKGESSDENLNQAVKNVATNMRAFLAAVNSLGPKPLVQERAVKKSKPEDKDGRMRGQALREMFETENTYLEQLKVLHTNFFDPLTKIENDKHITQLLQSTIATDVIGALPKMIQLTQKIRDDLLTAMAAMDPDIGYIFLQLGPNLDCYQSYINNITLLEEKLTKLEKKSHKFDALVKDYLKSTGAPSLGFYLILPIQRPPRYEMLLKELSKYSNNERGGENMAAAFKLIGEINQVINVRKKEDENRKLIQNLQKSIKSEEPLKLYVPGRMFVRQGALDTVKSKKIRKGDKLGQRMHYFMFNDILVQTKPSGGVLRSLTYQYKKTIPFEKFTLHDEVTDLKKSKVENVFTLTRDEEVSEWSVKEVKKKKKQQQEIYRFSCQTEEEKKSWMRDIEEAISVNKLMNKVGATSSRGGTVRVSRRQGVTQGN